MRGCVHTLLPQGHPNDRRGRARHGLRRGVRVRLCWSGRAYVGFHACRCASASALGRWVGLPVYVFMCFELEDTAAAAPADAAATPAES